MTPPDGAADMSPCQVDRIHPRPTERTVRQSEYGAQRALGWEGGARVGARATETSQGVWVSSGGGGWGLVVLGPGGGFVVGGVGFEAAVEDADQAVGELA